jgi:hypothetical protein
MSVISGGAAWICCDSAARVRAADHRDDWRDDLWRCRAEIDLAWRHRRGR